jgi:hypothetical protein
MAIWSCDIIFSKIKYRFVDGDTFVPVHPMSFRP